MEPGHTPPDSPGRSLAGLPTAAAAAAGVDQSPPLSPQQPALPAVCGMGSGWVATECQPNQTAFFVAVMSFVGLWL